MSGTVKAAASDQAAAKPHPRIYCIVARAARRAVVFRRGPAKRVRLLSWDLEHDTIDGGQWFNGRIYERRCDLTPSGNMLVYFAASYRKPLYSWTAISRPPYLSALSLWPKGDCWGGGGLFESERFLRVNHREFPLQLARGFTLPSHMTVEPMRENSGRGEDGPIMFVRALRDGWMLEENPDARRSNDVTLNRPNSFNHILRVTLDETNIKAAALTNREGHIFLDLGQIDWADFDHNNDLLFAQSGGLFRIRLRHESPGKLTPRLVADLNDMTFEPIKAPPWAMRRD